MRHQNLFINSYNKTNGDKNYDYNLSVPEHDISCREDEEMSLTITNFNTPNIFYNLTDQNNKYLFKTITNQGVTTTATMTIPIEGEILNLHRSFLFHRLIQIHLIHLFARGFAMRQSRR